MSDAFVDDFAETGLVPRTLEVLAAGGGVYDVATLLEVSLERATHLVDTAFTEVTAGIPSSTALAGLADATVNDVARRANAALEHDPGNAALLAVLLDTARLRLTLADHLG